MRICFQLTQRPSTLAVLSLSLTVLAGIPSVGQNYQVQVVEPQPGASYPSVKPLALSARVSAVDAASGESGWDVAARIVGPNGLVEVQRLYDDGTHGDLRGGDGVYTQSFFGYRDCPGGYHLEFVKASRPLMRSIQSRPVDFRLSSPAPSRWPYLFLAVPILCVLWVASRSRLRKSGDVESGETPMPRPALTPGDALNRQRAALEALEAANSELSAYIGSREALMQVMETSVQDTMRAGIPVLDDLDLLREDDKTAQMTYHRLFQELSRRGLSRIDPSIGEVFDPTIHRFADNPTGSPPYRVSKILESGYRFKSSSGSAAKEVVLKHALVVVEGDASTLSGN
jgi:molecular chaperone GrpE (heat shock protein)